MTGKLLHLLLPSQILSIMAFNPHHHISALVPGYFCRRRQLLVNNFQTLHWTLITLLLTNGVPRDDKISEKIKDPASFKIIKLSVIVFYIIITSLRKIMDTIFRQQIGEYWKSDKWFTLLAWLLLREWRIDIWTIYGWRIIRKFLLEIWIICLRLLGSVPLLRLGWIYCWDLLLCCDVDADSRLEITWQLCRSLAGAEPECKM